MSNRNPSAGELFSKRFIAAALGVSGRAIETRAMRERWPHQKDRCRGGYRHLYRLCDLPPQVQAAVKRAWPKGPGQASGCAGKPESPQSSTGLQEAIERAHSKRQVPARAATSCRCAGTADSCRQEESASPTAYEEIGWREQNRLRRMYRSGFEAGLAEAALRAQPPLQSPVDDGADAVLRRALAAGLRAAAQVLDGSNGEATP